MEFYSGRPTFRTIDGNQPPDVVTAAMDDGDPEASAAGAAGREVARDRLQVAGGARADACGEPLVARSSLSSRRWWRRA